MSDISSAPTPASASGPRGAPNLPKDGIAPLEGIIQTDWLDFTFTMNWKFTRPGTVTFEKDEPFCFITPVDYRALMNVEPQIVPISEKPELEAAFGRWQDARRSRPCERPATVTPSWTVA